MHEQDVAAGVSGDGLLDRAVKQVLEQAVLRLPTTIRSASRSSAISSSRSAGVPTSATYSASTGRRASVIHAASSRRCASSFGSGAPSGGGTGGSVPLGIGPPHLDLARRPGSMPSGAAWENKLEELEL